MVLNYILVGCSCTILSVYRFCYKPNLTVLKSCMMLSRSSIMVLCFDRDYKNSFLHVSLHKDLHVHGTHCMQIILMSRFQFPSPFPRLVSPRFFFFVNFSPALYYLIAWNRLGYEKCFVSKGYYNIQAYLPFLV